MIRHFFILWTSMLTLGMDSAHASCRSVLESSAIDPAQLAAGWGYASETINSQTVVYKFLKNSHPGIHELRGGDFYILNEDLDSGAEDDLFIGFEADTNHTYLVFRGVRLDGAQFNPHPKHDKRLVVNHKKGYFDPGIVFRFSGLPDQIKNELQDFLSEQQGGQRNLTCVRGVCWALREGADLTVVNQMGNGLLPSSTIKNFLENGLRDIDGNIYKPQIYVLNNPSLENTLSGGRSEELRKMRLFGLLMGGLSAAIVTLSALVAF